MFSRFIRWGRSADGASSEKQCEKRQSVHASFQKEACDYFAAVTVSSPQRSKAFIACTVAM